MLVFFCVLPLNSSSYKFLSYPINQSSILCRESKFTQCWRWVCHSNAHLLKHKPVHFSIQVDLIQEITQDGVIECLKELVSAKGPGYRKLSVQVVGASDPDAGTPPTLDALLGECCSASSYNIFLYYPSLVWKSSCAILLYKIKWSIKKREPYMWCITEVRASSFNWFFLNFSLPVQYFF